ncbi:MAG: V-type ATP synthase subunit E family protein [Sulfolobales archaeon]|nr:V-type ATP synthase subunit E family protein [Sulfolobales archaeon]MCX8185636.1 V-type ATP synthase subunit E family protein [Sulfolobales archaeon]MDW7969579.1 V-type ATP synthase subunit E family protein [Sulfolobales archaeon]
MSIESLRDGILSKARERAEEIIKNAEIKAKELVASSLKVYEERVKEESERRYRELRSNYERMYSNELFKLNIELLTLKNEILRDVRTNLINRLKSIDRNTRLHSLRNLLKESLNNEVFKGFNRFKVYVVKSDLELINEVLVEEGLKDFVEVKTLDDMYLGGLMLGSSDDSLLVDNTYLTRLERGLNVIIGKLLSTVFKEVRT